MQKLMICQQIELYNYEFLALAKLTKTFWGSAYKLVKNALIMKDLMKKIVLVSFISETSLVLAFNLVCTGRLVSDEEKVRVKGEA